MTTIDPPPPSAERLDSRLEFETLISDASASLISAPPEQLETGIERVLDAVRRFFNADRSVLLSVSADQAEVYVRLGSYSEGVPPVATDMNLAEAFPWSRHTLLAERAPVRIERIEDLPPEAAAEREMWLQMPIRSALSLPIESGGVVRHLIVLNTVNHENQWPNVFVPRLRLLGELIVGALVRREMLSELLEAEDGLRDLSRRLIRAHEDERALLARELHDDVTQRLAVLAIDAGRAEKAAPDPAHAQAMRDIRDGLIRLSEDVHSLAYQLHPSVLEELGLAEALRTECERVGRRGPLALALEIEATSADLSKDAALCLFRIAQEALNNVTRHAKARSAGVTLRHMDGGCLLVVQDDGAGFVQGQPGTGRSLGLASMRERIRLVNGTLDIESAPGQGTTVVAWVPSQGGSP